MAQTATEPRTDTITPDTDLEELVEPDDTVTIVQALNRVMRDVRVLRKTREQKGSGGNFKFRGIDDAMNALGPMFRRHGVICVPTLVSVDVEHGTTKAGGGMTVTRVQVDYTFYGPKGDTIVARTPGESFDSGDKSTAKAMSVAYRTCLLQTFTLPTDEPDPDETVEELAPRHAERARGQQGEDPWATVPLRPTGKVIVTNALTCDDLDQLRGLYRDAVTDGKAHGPQHVTNIDLGKSMREALNMLAPLEILDFLTKVKDHLESAGISVAEDVSAHAAPAPTTEGAGQ